MPYGGEDRTGTATGGSPRPGYPAGPIPVSTEVTAELSSPGETAGPEPSADLAPGQALATTTASASAEGQGKAAAAVAADDFDTMKFPRLIDAVLDDDAFATIEFPRLTAGTSPAAPAAGGGKAAAVPVLAPGVELLGEYRGSGLAQVTFLARNAPGQVVHLSRLLWLVLSAVDGTRAAGEIAARVSVEFGRAVSAGNIEYLLVNKLTPLGLVAGEDGPEPAAAPDAAILALRLRGTLFPETGVQIVARLFGPLFLPPVVVVTLGLLTTADVWLVRSGRLLTAYREVLARPLLLLVVLGLSIVSMVFHECGHAAACRYGGARPGRIGMGLYVLWPAMFTNVTDSYRLGRAGRIRTDLGGVYFNAVFAVVLAGAYRGTGYLPLAAAVLLVQVELAQQLLPSMRLDGYFILTDLVGVPDLFRQIGPVLRSLIPGQPADPRVGALRRSSRVALTAWVVVIVPLLGGELALILVGLPRLYSVFERTIASQASAMTVQFGRGEIATGLVSVISLVLVAFPAVGLCYVLVSTARVAFRLAARATRKHPALLAPLAAAVMAAAAGLTASWGLMPLSGHHPAAVDRPSLLPAAAPVAVGAVSSTSPPWPALVLDRRTGRPPAIEPRVPVRRHHRHRGAHAAATVSHPAAQVPPRAVPSTSLSPSRSTPKPPSPSPFPSPSASAAPFPSPSASAAPFPGPSASASPFPGPSASASSSSEPPGSSSDPFSPAASQGRN